MRIAILGEGYSGAVGAFVGGNLLADETCSTLAGHLRGYAGMAGDDASAAEFAAAYDEAAGEALSALAELVGSFGSLGHLAHASLANHLAAEIASGGRSVSAPPTRADDSVGVLVSVPPTSLGGDSPALPGPVSWVLDQIEGFVWPDADTERLRAAADAWRTSASSVSVLTAYCDRALADLADEQSPEVPLAIATTRDLRARVDTLGDQLAAIGGACAAYADQVDAKRSEMLDLLTQLAIELAAGAVIGGALSVVSAGLAAPAAGAAGSARLAWAAGELKLIVDSLRLVAGGTALELRAAATTTREISTFTARVDGARVIQTESQATVRTLEQRPGWLPRHEHSGSHTRGEHVSQSMDDLWSQIEGGKRMASTFPSNNAAESTLSNLIEAHEATVRAWLSGPRDLLRLDGDMGYPTGLTMDRLGNVTEVTRVRAILVRDSSMPDGWRLLTGFPQP